MSAPLLDQVRRLAAASRRTAAVCSGSFVLGAAGLLDGRRAVTHWAYCDALADAFPAATVESDPIYVRDGELVTSAGVTAGIDLALALVEEDHGPDLALEIARWLVVYAQRPGGQSQFSVQLAHRAASSGSLRVAAGLDRREPRPRSLRRLTRRPRPPLRAPARPPLPL